MIRFIIKKSFRYISGIEGTTLYSIEHDIDELERCLTKGGHGETEYERHELMGVEIIEKV